MTALYFVLVNGVVVPAADLAAFARWKATHDDHVRLTRLRGFCVSTIFLGVACGAHWQTGEPLVFETMVFKGNEAQSCVRTATVAEALAWHKITLQDIGAGARIQKRRRAAEVDAEVRDIAADVDQLFELPEGMLVARDALKARRPPPR